MTKHIRVGLSDDDMMVLQEQAWRNCRKPVQHARYLILSALGLLEPEQTQSEPSPPATEPMA
jgi:hypothetical protein